MDKISFLGLLVGLLAIVGGQVLEGGQIAALLQPTAFVIVVGGTLGAVMLQTPYANFVQGVRMTRWVWFPPKTDNEIIIREFARWGQIARREGLLALENTIEAERDPFIRKGMQLMIDGADPEKLRSILGVEVVAYENALKLSARIWEAAGGYSPTIGILGAVLGLIHVMDHLTEPSNLGAGIAVAFVATIYGVGLANLVYLPIANKLKVCVNRLTAQRELIVDGIVGIASGENPWIIENRLQAYLIQ